MPNVEPQRPGGGEDASRRKTRSTKLKSDRKRLPSSISCTSMKAIRLRRRADIPFVGVLSSILLGNRFPTTNRSPLLGDRASRQDHLLDLPLSARRGKVNSQFGSTFWPPFASSRRQVLFGMRSTVGRRVRAQTRIATCLRRCLEFGVAEPNRNGGLWIQGDSAWCECRLSLDKTESCP